MDLHFSKYQSLGSDYIIVDNRTCKYDQILNDAAFLENMNDRNFGVGAVSINEITIATNTSIKGVQYEVKFYDDKGKPGVYAGTPVATTAAAARKLGLFEDNLLRFLYNDTPYEVLYDDHKEIYWIPFKDFNLDDIVPINGGYFLNPCCAHYVQFAKNIDDINLIEESKHINNWEYFKASSTVGVDFIEELSEANTFKARTCDSYAPVELNCCGSGGVSIALVNLYVQREKETKSMTNGSLTNRKIQQDTTKKLIKVKYPGGDLLVSYKMSEEYVTDIHIACPAMHVFDGHMNYETK